MLLYHVLKASKIWRIKIVSKLSRFMEKFRVHPYGLKTLQPCSTKGRQENEDENNFGIVLREALASSVQMAGQWSWTGTE